MDDDAPPRLLGDSLPVFARIGLLSFGGPAGQIALMHRELVEERDWVSEEDFLHGLNFCNLLPGPEAQQLATWIGWRLHGWRGGLAAGMLFILPGALVVFALSALYAVAADLAWFNALFLGIKAAVLAIVVEALLRISRRALQTGFKRALAIAAFMALFLFDLPFPLIVLGAGVLGAAAAMRSPGWLALQPGAGAPVAGPGPWAAILRSIIVWGAIWALPLLAVAATLGREHVLWDIGVFFSKLAVVTFGGAYAVLAYMAQEAVQGFGWLRPGEMADGLGLAETTPGPLILVTQFVGYLAAFRAPEPFTPFVAGMIGAGLTTWVTFAPCFLWIFAFAPWIDRLAHADRLRGALAGVTAAVVGVIANLTAWFALHVIFAEVTESRAGPLRSYLPEWASFDWRAAVLAATALVLTFALNWSVLRVLGLCALGGLLVSLAG
ncbi:chromate efflux transporter [Qipengyuania sp. 6B39]|uniref:chromate efflux transporter n=1 Tax=Qipengyuania proteolytica TaxID=2867239 RepID=UPI001C88EDE5|nr:chromate efflux transporter [Qipengyuania proteolytica]MBX7495416.1 chromate efflux transporter [Qipengyuania proteolytica]